MRFETLLATVSVSYKQTWVTEVWWNEEQLLPAGIITLSNAKTIELRLEASVQRCGQNCCVAQPYGFRNIACD
jgi:hypothetical protein